MDRVVLDEDEGFERLDDAFSRRKGVVFDEKPKIPVEKQKKCDDKQKNKDNQKIYDDKQKKNYGQEMYDDKQKIYDDKQKIYDDKQKKNDGQEMYDDKRKIYDDKQKVYEYKQKICEDEAETCIKQKIYDDKQKIYNKQKIFDDKQKIYKDRQDICNNEQKNCEYELDICKKKQDNLYEQSKIEKCCDQNNKFSKEKQLLSKSYDKPKPPKRKLKTNDKQTFICQKQLLCEEKQLPRKINGNYECKNLISPEILEDNQKQLNAAVETKENKQKNSSESVLLKANEKKPKFNIIIEDLEKQNINKSSSRQNKTEEGFPYQIETTIESQEATKIKNDSLKTKNVEAIKNTKNQVRFLANEHDIADTCQTKQKSIETPTLICQENSILTKENQKTKIAKTIENKTISSNTIENKTKSSKTIENETSKNEQTTTSDHDKKYKKFLNYIKSKYNKKKTKYNFENKNETTQNDTCYYKQMHTHDVINKSSYKNYKLRKKTDDKNKLNEELIQQTIACDNKLDENFYLCILNEKEEYKQNLMEPDLLLSVKQKQNAASMPNLLRIESNDILYHGTLDQNELIQKTTKFGRIKENLKGNLLNNFKSMLNIYETRVQHVPSIENNLVKSDICEFSKSQDDILNSHPKNKLKWTRRFTSDENLMAKTVRKCSNLKKRKNPRVTDVNKRLKSQIWSSVVTIVLVEGKNLLACDPETGTSDPYVKFRLGNEKYKSRIVWRSLNPRWLEQFDLHLYDDGDQQLEITVWDKDRSRDDFVGRCVIDLSSLAREKTHSLWKELEDGAGSLHLLLTISGTTASETISDLTTYEENPRERENIVLRYAWPKTFQNIKDVGHLTVKVYRATGLAAADLGGKSDPFCVLELGNARLQTQTEYKTLSPSWQKIFTFNVKDINNVLEVTVYDEDRDHKVEFLGKVAIPLLRIKNGEKRWYALKDKKLRARAKGNTPQILMELTVIWNPIRACIRTLNPKEEKYMQQEIKFKRQVFVKNVLRLKNLTLHLYEYGKILQSCFEWESTFQSFIALIFWLIICYYFEPWMVPISGLLIFFKQYLVRKLTGPETVPWDEIADSDLDDEDEEDKDKEEKKSLKERLQAIQEVTQGVQNAIGKIATFGESIKNTFNFTVPYLSWIAVTLLVGATFVLYLIPIRYLLMLWGTNKFFRRILRPHSVPNNELLDLISRIPDDEMLLAERQFPAFAPYLLEKLSYTKKIKNFSTLSWNWLKDKDDKEDDYQHPNL